jgi:hypothetical protein
MGTTAQAHRVITGLFSAIVASSNRSNKKKYVRGGCRNRGSKTKCLFAVILMAILLAWWATPEQLASDNYSGGSPEQVARMRTIGIHEQQNSILRMVDIDAIPGQEFRDKYGGHIDKLKELQQCIVTTMNNSDEEEEKIIQSKSDQGKDDELLVNTV